MRKLIVVFCALIAIGCAKIDYFGESFPPTSQIDTFFDEADVEANYKVIGRIFASVEGSTGMYSNQKFLEKIKQKALENGGHGVIILGFDRVPTGSSYSRSSTTKENEDKTVTYEHGSEDIKDRREITALVIRYRQEGE